MSFQGILSVAPRFFFVPERKNKLDDFSYSCASRIRLNVGHLIHLRGLSLERVRRRETTAASLSKAVRTKYRIEKQDTFTFTVVQPAPAVYDSLIKSTI